MYDYLLALCVCWGAITCLKSDYSGKELDEASDMIKEWLIKDKSDKFSQHNINIPEDMYKELQKVKKKFFKPANY